MMHKIHCTDCSALRKCQIIHQTGLIAQCRLDTSGFEHPFTGCFKGAENCLVRVSLARRSQPGTSDKVTATPG